MHRHYCTFMCFRLLLKYRPVVLYKYVHVLNHFGHFGPKLSLVSIHAFVGCVILSIPVLHVYCPMYVYNSSLNELGDSLCMYTYSHVARPLPPLHFYCSQRHRCLLRIGKMEVGMGSVYTRVRQCMVCVDVPIYLIMTPIENENVLCNK